MTHNKLITNPIIIFNITWISVILLYHLKLSEILIYSPSEFITPLILILVFFSLGCLVCYFLINSIKHLKYSSGNFNFLEVTKKIKILFIFWLFMSPIEVIYSRGLPILWLITGNQKTYADFGIPSVHGILNSLISSISLVSFLLFLKFKYKKGLFYVGFCFFVGVIYITRHMIIVNFLQILCCYIIFRKISYKRVISIICIGILTIYIFGIIGDFRAGLGHLLSMAEPTENFPKWLPSGFLWIYIYLTTPLNNLFNAIREITPQYNLTFPNTLMDFLPSVIKNIIFVNAMNSDSPDFQVHNSFNVSTSYISPYLDLGYLGIMSYGLLFGFISFYFWESNKLRNQLIYCVFFQIIVLSIFYNHLFSLPIIFQIIWISVLLRSKRWANPVEILV